MSLISPDNFQHILRVMNTNLEGKRNTMFAITAIKGVGRRFANIALKKVRKEKFSSSLPATKAGYTGRNPVRGRQERGSLCSLSI